MASRKKADKLTIVYMPVGDLIPDPKNSNTHPPEQIEQLRQSIRSYGFTKPVLLKDDGKTIGAGHGAWMAAKQEGLKEIPTVTVRGLTPVQWRAYAIVDNQVARNSVWDMDILRGELNELKGFGFDLGAMGFGAMELGTIGVAGFGQPERIARAEETPEPPKNPVVKRGELWLLGGHRLIIGDSTNAEDVHRLLNGAVPTLMATDPPYGVNYDPTWRMAAGVNKNKAKMGKVSNDDRADWTPAWALFPGDVAYVWHGGLHADVVEMSLKSAGFGIRSQIIWVKDRFALGRSDYHWRHEPAWYAVREGKRGHWASDRKQDTVWNIPARDDGGHGHGTQKPIECMRRPIINNSKPGGGVYDPFCGSGTTLIACEMEKRECYAVELDPGYAQVIIERWQKFSGLPGVREDGATLEDLRDGKVASRVLKHIKAGKEKLVPAKPKKGKAA